MKFFKNEFYYSRLCQINVLNDFGCFHESGGGIHVVEWECHRNSAGRLRVRQSIPISSMSSSERRFSLTLSEDDLRPHMRKPSEYLIMSTDSVDRIWFPEPKPEDPRRNPMSKPILESEIEALRLKFEKREEVKKEVKRRVEEEEKDRERKRKEEEMRKITEDLWRRSQQDDRKDQKDLPRLGRRFNDSQYFKWDSVDEIPAIPEESVPRPSSRRYSHSKCSLERISFQRILSDPSFFFCNLRAVHFGSSSHWQVRSPGSTNEKRCMRPCRRFCRSSPE